MIVLLGCDSVALQLRSWCNPNVQSFDLLKLLCRKVIIGIVLLCFNIKVRYFWYRIVYCSIPFVPSIYRCVRIGYIDTLKNFIVNSRCFLFHTNRDVWVVHCEFWANIFCKEKSLECKLLLVVERLLIAFAFKMSSFFGKTYKLFVQNHF